MVDSAFYGFITPLFIIVADIYIPAFDSFREYLTISLIHVILDFFYNIINFVQELYKRTKKNNNQKPVPGYVFQYHAPVAEQGAHRRDKDNQVYCRCYCFLQIDAKQVYIVINIIPYKRS